MRTRKSKQFSNKIVVSNLVLFSMDSLAVTDLFPHNSDPENLVTEEFSIKCHSIWTILFCLLRLLPSFGVCIQFTRACWMPKHVFLLLLFVYFLIFCSFVLRRWNYYTLASPKLQLKAVSETIKSTSLWEKEQKFKYKRKINVLLLWTSESCFLLLCWFCIFW